MALNRCAAAKPVKGTAYLASKDRRADRRDAEQVTMQAALKRDSRRCRWPGCTGKYRGLDLPIDAAHQLHRGMGGNPDGSRTRTTTQLVALCRNHHQQWDGDQIDLQPLTSDGFDGLLTFHERDQETGRMEHMYTETAIGISVAVGA